MIVVLMGVSGVGKTTVGRALASHLACEFIEGDDFHPSANVAKLRAGDPLSDADRLPWLQRLAQELASRREAGHSCVLTCSALKRAYREVLRDAAPELRLVYLTASPELLETRMASRSGHFMSRSLLESQLQTLEAPDGDEHAIQVATTDTPDSIVREIHAELSRS